MWTLCFSSFSSVTAETNHIFGEERLGAGCPFSIFTKNDFPLLKDGSEPRAPSPALGIAVYLIVALIVNDL